MSIDYLTKPCRTNPDKVKFGLCDDPPPLSNPAYIDEEEPTKWIEVVKNSKEKNIEFYAIDNCVDIRRDDGTMDSRCDGVLSYEDKLIFIELKERAGGQWLKKGREQLTATINRFKQEVDITQFGSIKAYACNSLRPQSHTGQASNIQKFKDDTGYILFGKQNIDIE